MRSWSTPILALALALAAAAGCKAQAGNGEPTDKNYTVAARMEPSAPRQGSTAGFVLTIAPRSPWVMKTSTPLKVKLQASPGLVLAKQQLDAKDIVDPESAAKSVRTSVEARATGAQQISADVEFFLCTDEMCKRELDSVKLPVTVR